MKKIIAVLLITLLACGLFGCGSAVGAEEIVDKVNGKMLADTGIENIVYMGQKLSKTDFCSRYGVEQSDVKDVCALVSSAIGYCDALIVVRADNADSAGKIEQVFRTNREALITQYRDYSVNGSYQRAQGSLVLTRGDYVFFICVGIMPADTDAPLEFELDVQTAMDVINELVPAQ